MKLLPLSDAIDMFRGQAEIQEALERIYDDGWREGFDAACTDWQIECARFLFASGAVESREPYILRLKEDFFLSTPTMYEEFVRLENDEL